MEIKLFGKSLFEVKKNQGLLVYNNAIDSQSKSEFLIDFYKDTGGNIQPSSSYTYGVISDLSGPVAVTSVTNSAPRLEPKKATPKTQREFSPKDVYKLQMLHDKAFKIKTDPAYIDEQLETLREKFGMIKTQEFDMNRGTTEIGSMIIRLENRKKYPEFKTFYDEYPYTTTDRISSVIKKHSYLQLGNVSQFLADMPKEAVNVMKDYTSQTKRLCDKKPVFYIVANKKDFQKTEKRRDPILLAQSPFGHFWQILGAWDKEMLLVEEL